MKGDSDGGGGGWQRLLTAAKRCESCVITMRESCVITMHTCVITTHNLRDYYTQLA